MTLEIRQATPADDAELASIDRRTWSTRVSPGPQPTQDRPYFSKHGDHFEVLVAISGGVIAGSVRVRQPLPLESNSHVREISGIAVDPDHQRAGVGVALMSAAERFAVDQGASRMTLRVLSANPGAVAFYESLGYESEGALRGEFVIDGEEIDDLMLAKRLS